MTPSSQQNQTQKNQTGMPRVSVIIPSYNTATYLQAALDSVLTQTFDDWEVVLCDDGSTDNTRSLVEAALPAFHGRLRYVYQTNKGLPAARNTAIRNSSGEFLALLDADDVWLPHRLERGVALMDRDRSLGLIHGHVARIDTRGEFVEYPARPPLKYLSGSIAHNIYARRAHLICPTILFRKECVDTVGGFDETMRATEDRDMWFRIAEKYRVGYIDEVLANYRISPNSMSRDSDRMMKWQTYFIEKHKHSKACGVIAARQAFGRMYRERGDAIFNTGRVGESLRWYLRALRSYPVSGYDLYMLFRALAEPALRKVRAQAEPLGSVKS
jgi:glycosyltransferase involved in cell wall biosynthesis